MRTYVAEFGNLVDMAHAGSGSHTQGPEPTAAGAEPTPDETATAI